MQIYEWKLTSYPKKGTKNTHVTTFSLDCIHPHKAGDWQPNFIHFLFQSVTRTENKDFLWDGAGWWSTAVTVLIVIHWASVTNWPIQEADVFVLHNVDKAYYNPTMIKNLDSATAHPSSVSFMMSQISMLTVQSSFWRPPSVALSAGNTKENIETTIYLKNKRCSFIFVCASTFVFEYRCPLY